MDLARGCDLGVGTCLWPGFCQRQVNEGRLQETGSLSEFKEENLNFGFISPFQVSVRVKCNLKTNFVTQVQVER